VLVADDLSELAFGFEHPGGGPAQAHVAVLPALDVAAGGAADADHRLDRVRAAQGPPELLVDAESLQRHGLGEALAQRRRGASAQLPGEGPETVQCGGVIGEVPGRPQAALIAGRSRSARWSKTLRSL